MPYYACFKFLHIFISVKYHHYLHFSHFQESEEYFNDEIEVFATKDDKVCFKTCFIVGPDDLFCNVQLQVYIFNFPTAYISINRI